MKPRKPSSRNDRFDVDAMMGSAHEASGFLKALAHEGRLLILCLLMDGEKSVSEIEDMLSLRQPAISQQLARLRADGLVETRRDGKSIFYSLVRSEVRDIVGMLHRSFCEAPRMKARFNVAARHPPGRAAAHAKST
jgi:DNA-binding transcriptional ArsR family regulator